MKWNHWLAIGAMSGLLSVVAGSFGAHALKKTLSPHALEVFETGARYQMYHALALMAVAFLASRTPGGTINASGWLFCVGTVLFCGSLYALALSGVAKFGMVAPLGGFSMILGWALLAWTAWRTSS
jgi:uncharacterized membrane protein YgdD (TMEM256/DUF423 family)